MSRLKALRFNLEIKPSSEPVEVELAMWEKAKEWGLAELSKKGHSDDLLLDLLVHDTEVARFTRQRMEELSEASADVSTWPL